MRVGGGQGREIGVLSSLSMAVMSEICWLSRRAETRGIRFLPNAE